MNWKQSLKTKSSIHLTPKVFGMSTSLALKISPLTTHQLICRGQETSYCLNLFIMSKTQYKQKINIIIIIGVRRMDGTCLSIIRTAILQIAK